MAKSKQSWSANMLATMYKEASEKNQLDSSSFNCFSQLKAANDILTDYTLKTWGEFFDKNEFHTTSYNESPSYYASYQDWRGNKIKSDEDLCEESYILFWEAWGMLDYYHKLDQQRFTELLPNNAESIGVTILCEYEIPKNNWSDGKLNLPESEIVWGNTAILSEEDWDKCQEAEIEQYTDLVWHDVCYFITESIVNVFQAIDDDLEWWNGDDGVLSEIEEMLNDGNFTLQTHLAIFEINTAMKNSKLSFARRIEKVKKITAKFQNLYNNFTEEQYA
jgi:hypothetical protein